MGRTSSTNLLLLFFQMAASRLIHFHLLVIGTRMCERVHLPYPDRLLGYYSFQRSQYHVGTRQSHEQHLVQEHNILAFQLQREDEAVKEVFKAQHKIFAYIQKRMLQHIPVGQQKAELRRLHALQIEAQDWLVVQRSRVAKTRLRSKRTLGKHKLVALGMR